MMDTNCKTCTFSKGFWCNRLVVPGGYGNHDKLASDYLKDNSCIYYEKGTPKFDCNKPNFENS